MVYALTTAGNLVSRNDSVFSTCTSTGGGKEQEIMFGSNSEEESSSAPLFICCCGLILVIHAPNFSKTMYGGNGSLGACWCPLIWHIQKICSSMSKLNIYLWCRFICKYIFNFDILEQILNMIFLDTNVVEADQANNNILLMLEVVVTKFSCYAGRSRRTAYAGGGGGGGPK